MVERDRQHPSVAEERTTSARRRRSRTTRWLPAVAVATVVAWGVGVQQLDELVAWWEGSGTSSPADVATPPGLDLPSPAPLAVPAEPVAAAGSGVPDPAAVRRALADPLRDPALGGRVVAAVGSLTPGDVVVAARGRGLVGPDVPVLPASLTKILTAAGVLELLGPDHVFTTRTVLDGDRLVLVGGGDPYLTRAPAEGGAGADASYAAPASVASLARRSAAALRAQGLGTRARPVRVGWDDSLFSGPAVNPRWEPDYVPAGVVAPIGALMVDGGRPADGFGRVADPARAAADLLADGLRDAGLVVRGAPRRAVAPDAAEELAAVDSAPLAQVVERAVATSDNEATEVLARHAGLAADTAGSTVAGVRALTDALASLGVPVGGLRLADGSGLSRQGRIPAATILATLAAAASEEEPDLRAVLTGLPVAGATGSLALRFGDGDPAGPGLVRAKTGTLTGVHGLGGLVTTADGSVLLFVLVADRVPLGRDLDARLALDRAAAALAGCRCGSAPGSP